MGYWDHVIKSTMTFNKEKFTSFEMFKQDILSRFSLDFNIIFIKEFKSHYSVRIKRKD